MEGVSYYIVVPGDAHPSTVIGPFSHAGDALVEADMIGPRCSIIDSPEPRRPAPAVCGECGRPKGSRRINFGEGEGVHDDS